MCLKKILPASLGIFLLILLSSHPSLGQGEFYRYPDNPVLGNGGWDGKRADAPFVLREGGTYFMWYAGGSLRHPNPTHGIGYATSPDGESWRKYQGNPILTRGLSGSWDVSGISSPSIIRLGDTYFMAYAGTNDVFWRIGLAASSDRVTWTKYSGNPVFTQGEYGEWDDQGVGDPMVIFDGTEFKMYYTGYDGSTTRTQIGLATSTDGLTWNRAPNNPVLTEGSSGDWDRTGVASPFVFFDDLTYYMWYSGYANWNLDNPYYSIGLATSTDGYNWEKVDSLNPILEHNEQGWFDYGGVFDPSVIKVRDFFQMWFAGRAPPIPEDTQIGLARSTPLFLDVTPFTTKIPAGGYLDLSVTVRSTSPDTVAFQLWSDATLPNGNPYSGNPVFGPEDFELVPNGTFSGGISLYVPYQAPPNSGYRLTTGVGNYPNDIWDFSWFEFEILPPP